jgi:hypothetical protein
MKIKPLYTLFLFFYCHWLLAQCPSSIVFSTQAQIDGFIVNYPGCTQILGNVTIKESVSGGITNLDSLSPISSIGSIFGGGLEVTDNAALISIEGLIGLTSIVGDLKISNNPTLANLNGLDSLI